MDESNEWLSKIEKKIKPEITFKKYRKKSRLIDILNQRKITSFLTTGDTLKNVTKCSAFKENEQNFNSVFSENGVFIDSPTVNNNLKPFPLSENLNIKKLECNNVPKITPKESKCIDNHSESLATIKNNDIFSNTSLKFSEMNDYDLNKQVTSHNICYSGSLDLNSDLEFQPFIPREGSFTNFILPEI